MRLRFLAAAVVAVVTLSLLPAAALAAPVAANGSTSGPPYYLALGDSLAQGVQPTPSGTSRLTNQGYVDDLYAVYRRQVPNLRLVKLGCPGETTGTMINGGVCSYSPARSQLAAVVNFLHVHPRHVAVVTIDIGANNVTSCVPVAGATCPGITKAGQDLSRILKALRAAYPALPIVGMNYYDPFLAEWLQGPAGQARAKVSVGMTNTFNNVLKQAYTAFRVPVANVSAAFFTNIFTPVPVVNLPLNVATICSLTWMCAPAPVGPNIHPRPRGYSVIAGAFLAKLGSLRTRSLG